jgi:hypothetical protein
MGLMGGIIAPDDYRKWPQLDRTDPDYLIDLNPKGRMAVAAVRVRARPEPRRNLHISS